MNHVYCKHGGSLKTLSDNGTEFKNKLMEEVSKELGVEYKVYSPPYRPQSNTISLRSTSVSSCFVLSVLQLRLLVT